MIADLESKNSGPRNKHEKNENIWGMEIFDLLKSKIFLYIKKILIFNRSVYLSYYKNIQKNSLFQLLFFFIINSDSLEHS